MIKISLIELKELANNLYFQMDEEQLKKLQKEFENLVILLDEISQLDVSTYAPTDFCRNNSCNELREDLISSNDNDGIEFLNNSSNKKERFIVIK